LAEGSSDAASEFAFDVEGVAAIRVDVVEQRW
jgi:hypothetical protein